MFGNPSVDHRAEIHAACLAEKLSAYYMEDKCYIELGEGTLHGAFGLNNQHFATRNMKKFKMEKRNKHGASCKYVCEIIIIFVDAYH